MSRPSTRDRPVTRAMIGQVSSRLALALAATTLLLAAFPAAGLAACANPVACENEKAGPAPSAWQVTRRGRLDDPGLRDVDERQRRRDDPLQGQDDRRRTTTSTSTGWATTRATARACRRPNIRPTASLPQTQPACLTDAVDGPDRLRQLGRVGVVDRPVRPRCPGVYIARLVRDDTGGASQIPFVVRDDAAHSDMLVRTSDATWQAYNKYGGNSLYSCTSPLPARQPRGLQGRVLGLLQPPLRRHDHAGQRPLVPVLRRVPDDPVHRAQRLRRELHEPGRRRRQRRAPAQPQGHRLQRPRRVLVRRRSARTSRRRATPASASRSSAATRCSGRRAGSRAAPTAPPRRTGR